MDLLFYWLNNDFVVNPLKWLVARILDVEAIMLCGLRDWTFDSLDAFKQLYLGSELINQLHVVPGNSLSESLSEFFGGILYTINLFENRLRHMLTLVPLVVGHITILDDRMALWTLYILILYSLARRSSFQPFWFTVHAAYMSTQIATAAGEFAVNALL